MSKFYRICPKVNQVIYISVFNIKALEIVFEISNKVKNWQILQRTITPVNILQNCPKVNQVIYTSSTISVFNIKALEIVFEISCNKVKNWQILQRTITPTTFYRIAPKVNQVIYISSPICVTNIKAIA